MNEIPIESIQAMLDAKEIITVALAEIGVIRPDSFTDMLFARLAQHDPPILLGFPDEFKD